MTDRPIIFSAPMVRALLAGRKTQTRRLSTSPLQRVEVGDRLYVRESYAVRGVYSDVVEAGYKAHESASHTEFVEQIPVALASGATPTWPKYKPSIHMPRWVSRATLIVEGVKVEPLRAMSSSEAIAEGIHAIPFYPCDGFPLCDGYSHLDGDGKSPLYAFPTEAFEHLWNSLHTAEGERWQDKPDVVALTFRIERSNIDRISA